MYYNSRERDSEDATGIWSPSNGLTKDAIKAKEFLSTKEIKEDYMFLGHVRKKSFTHNNVKTAHPHQAENVILIHNGLLTDLWDLCKLFKLNWSNFDTDSEVLCKILSQEGNASVFTKALGSIATIFTDTVTECSMYVYRNEERPLFRGKLEEGMYMSSEDKALKIIGCKDIKEFKPFCLYTIENGEVKSSNRIKKPVKAVATHYNPHRYGPGMYANNYPDNDEAIHESNYYPSTFRRIRNVSWAEYSASDITDKWVLRESVGSTITGKFTPNEWYFCVREQTRGNAGTWGELTFDKDDEGMEVTSYKSSFKTMDYSIRVNDYVIAMRDMTLETPEKEVFAKKGDLLQVTDLYMNKLIRCVNLSNKKYGRIDKRSYRIALNKEIEEKLKVTKERTMAEQIYDETKSFIEKMNELMKAHEKALETYDDNKIEGTFRAMKDALTDAQKTLTNMDLEENVNDDACMRV